MALRDELATVRGEVDLERDRVLVARSQGGDGSAFAELYTCYHDRLQRFCNRRLHDGEEAADVTQEAFTRAWRALPAFAGERRFYPWLTVIAGNLCTDLLRKQAPEPAHRRPRPPEAPGPRAGGRREHRRLGHGRGRRGARREGAGEAVGPASARARPAGRLRPDLPRDRHPRGSRDQHGRDPLVAGAPSAQREYAALVGWRRPGCAGAGGRDRAQVGRPPGPPRGRAAGGPGGGVAGSLAVALTSAAVATVAFLPAGAGPRPASPAALASAALPRVRGPPSPRSRRRHRPSAPARPGRGAAAPGGTCGRGHPIGERAARGGGPGGCLAAKCERRQHGGERRP